MTRTKKTSLSAAAVLASASMLLAACGGSTGTSGGDASSAAAGDCASKEVFCVGLVTDLNPHLVARVLLSLRAELVRREHLFNARGVKDIIEFEKTGEPACPPALVIVIDEFAALKKDMPEFVDGVIDIAQRGRSLGVHLILATQRPTGVIDDNIVANTNLRISLRMNDESDAKDIIGHPMSAHFDPSLPGRGAARVGPGRIHLFQSAYPGARTPDRPERPPIVLQEFDFGSRRHWKAAQSASWSTTAPTRNGSRRCARRSSAKAPP